MMPTDDAARPFELLVREIRLSFFALKAAAEALHADPDGLTAGHRGVLESLADGARTVPALARARPVSRQHIQILVNRLLALGLVLTRENPASRRSPLVELTPAGRERFQHMLARERAAYPDDNLPIPEHRLREAAETLRGLRAVLGREGEG
jgi:DNA-binding MarR family transcriptional regulator